MLAESLRKQLMDHSRTANFFLSREFINRDNDLFGDADGKERRSSSCGTSRTFFRA